MIATWFKRCIGIQDELLPVGVEEFYAWSEAVVALTPLPLNDSMRFVLSSLILELPKTRARVPKEEMADMLMKAAANQVASFVLQDVKGRRMDADKAEKPVVQEVQGV